MKKVFPNASIEKDIIGEIVGFDREDKSDACELISSLTGDNSRQVVSFGTEAGLFQELGISTVVCGPGSIEQAHKIDEFIVLDELKKCLKFLDGIKNKSILINRSNHLQLLLQDILQAVVHLLHDQYQNVYNHQMVHQVQYQLH